MGLMERLEARGGEGDNVPLPSGLDYLRASSIRMFFRCPRQFWYVHVKGERMPTGAAAAAGTGMHRAAEQALIRRMQGHGTTADEAAEIARDEVQRVASKDEVDFGADGIGPVTDRSVLLARKWTEHYLPAFKHAPLAVEETFYTQLGGVTVKGTIDVVEHDGHLTDWKTSGKLPSPNDVAANPQSEIYLASRERNVGMSFRYLVYRTPTKRRTEPEVDVKDFAIVGSDAQRAPRLAEATVREVARALNADHFPRKREGWHCSIERCPFYARCMSGKDRP